MSEIVPVCPRCGTEYREGFLTCSDCNVPLVRRLDSDAGDHLVPLAREGSFEFVAELLDRLEKENIPYVIEAGTGLQLLDGEVTRPARPQPWEARVWVAESAQDAGNSVLSNLTEEVRFGQSKEIVRRYANLLNELPPSEE